MKNTKNLDRIFAILQEYDRVYRTCSPELSEKIWAQKNEILVEPDEEIKTWKEFHDLCVQAGIACPEKSWFLELLEGYKYTFERSEGVSNNFSINRGDITPSMSGFSDYDREILLSMESSEPDSYAGNKEYPANAVLSIKKAMHITCASRLKERQIYSNSTPCVDIEVFRGNEKIASASSIEEEDVKRVSSLFQEYSWRMLLKKELETV